MRMAKSWNRYFIKAKFFCLAVIVCALAVNIALAVFVNRFIETANKNFFRPVTVQGVYYLPPHFILLRNFSIYDNDAAAGKAILTVPAVRLTFSLWRLAVKRRFHVLSIYCLRPAANRYEFMRFVGKNFQQILEFFKSLPLQDIRLSLREAALKSSKNNIRSEIEVDFTLNLKANSVGAYGSLRKNVYVPDQQDPLSPAGIIKSTPLQYTFKGSLTPSGIAVEKMELSGEDLRCEFWGETHNAVSQLKGFIFAKTIPEERTNEDDSFLKKFQSTHHALAQWGKPKIIGLPGANLSIFNIDAQIKFNYPRIEVERLNFLVNDNPVEIKGDVRLTEPVSFNVNLHSKFRSLEKPADAGLKDISLSLSANSQNKKLVTNGTLHIDFSENKAGDLPLENVELVFNGLGLAFEEAVCKTHMDKVDFSCKTDANAYRIILDNLDTEIPESDATPKIIKLRCRCYDGSLEGRARVALKKFTPVINSVLEVRNATANRLEGILIHFSKVYGKFNSRMRFSSFPKMVLKGGLRIQNGSLNDFEFFKWLAEVFALPSLRKVDFKDAFADFSVDESGAELRNMRLDSDTVKIGGYFKLGKGDLVSSKMSLIFGEALLRESPKFTPLLNVLQNELNVITFDFQLSGDLNRMNFKWLQSDFKDKVKKAIPNFVERNIEKNIEEFVGGIGE